MLEEIISDLQSALNVKINKNNIVYYTDGATDSIVFSIDNKYLVKTVDDNTFNTQLEFLKFYEDIDEFQKIIHFNKSLKYICFLYIEGDKFYQTKVNSNTAVNQIYNIVRKYKKYDYKDFGYLYEDEKSWYEFLCDEVNYSYDKIKHLDISINKVSDALEIVKNYKVEKYLIHGDFGTHNFLVNKSKIKVIDPMPVVGDYLYDFYFSIFSDVSIFESTNLNSILKYFDRDDTYKRAMVIITFFIRMSRSYVYDKDHFNAYLDYYNKL